MPRKTTLRRTLSELLPSLLILSTLAIAWSGLKALTHSAHPVLVVTSQSMEPAFQRGDLIFISNRAQFVSVGDIPVVWFPGKELPLVHRAIEVEWRLAAQSDRPLQSILTKGDNNQADDFALYPMGQQRVYGENVVGLVKGYVPKLGHISLQLKEHIWLAKPLAVASILVGLLR